MFRVDIDVEGLAKRLALMGQRIENSVEGIRASAATSLREIISQQFDSEGSAFGDRWQPLMPGYARVKASRYSAQSILVRSGKMRAELTSSNLRAVIQVFGRVQTVEFLASPRAPYWKFHQTGTRTMPKRAIIPEPLPAAFTGKLRRAIRSYIFTGVANAG